MALSVYREKRAEAVRAFESYAKEGLIRENPDLSEGSNGVIEELVRENSENLVDSFEDVVILRNSKREYYPGFVKSAIYYIAMTAVSSAVVAVGFLTILSISDAEVKKALLAIGNSLIS